MLWMEAIGATSGQVYGSSAVLASGSVGTLCEQIVAGANRDGGVLMQCGTSFDRVDNHPGVTMCARPVDHPAHNRWENPDRRS